MKSYKEWENKNLYEFVGPNGQIDPQGTVPAPAMPMAPMDNNYLMHAIDRIVHMISMKSPQQMMQLQKVVNDKIQQAYMSKSQSAANRGALMGYNDFKQMRTNHGQPLAV